MVDTLQLRYGVELIDIIKQNRGIRFKIVGECFILHLPANPSVRVLNKFKDIMDMKVDYTIHFIEENYLLVY